MGWSIGLIRRRLKVRVLLGLQTESHSSNGQSTGLLNRGLKVQIFLGLQRSRSSIGQSIGFLNRGLQVRILSRSQKESRQILVCCGLLLMSSTTVVKVQFLCSPQKKRSIEVMANLPDCRSGTASSKCKAFVNSKEKIYVMMNNLAQTATIHGKFPIRLSLGEDF